MTLPGAVVAFVGVVGRWWGGRCGVWGSLSTVIGVVNCRLAVVLVFAVGMISSPTAAASEASTVAAAIAICVRVHGGTEVAIGVANVL